MLVVATPEDGPGELMGLQKQHLEDYAKAVVKSEFEQPGEDDVRAMREAARAQMLFKLLAGTQMRLLAALAVGTYRHARRSLTPLADIGERSAIAH